MALLLLGLSACGTMGYKFQAPQLSIVSVELLKGDLRQQQLRVRMHVQNPNDRVLPISSISYEIEVAGQKFAHGESERDFLVPARGETDFDVGVTANAAGALLRLIGSGAHADNIDYRLSGTVKLSAGLLRSIPFEKSGSFGLRR